MDSMFQRGVKVTNPYRSEKVRDYPDNHADITNTLHQQHANRQPKQARFK